MTRTDSAKAQQVRKHLKFWPWFFKDGVRRFFSPWLVVHVAIGASLGLSVPQPLHDIANTVLLPLGGLLIGLTFAWAGNALAILQTSEVRKIGQQDTFRTWVFTYQTAVLAVLTILILWGLVGMKAHQVLADLICCGPWCRLAARTALFALSSLALRECWQVVSGSQSMLLMRDLYMRASDENPTLDDSK